jgi:hypothetical protein
MLFHKVFRFLIAFVSFELSPEFGFDKVVGLSAWILSSHTGEFSLALGVHFHVEDQKILEYFVGPLFCHVSLHKLD